MRPRNSGAVLRQTRDPPLTTPTDTRIAYLVTPLQKVARDAARFVPTAAPKARRQHACACCSHAHGRGTRCCSHAAPCRDCPRLCTSPRDVGGHSCALWGRAVVGLSRAPRGAPSRPARFVFSRLPTFGLHLRAGGPRSPWGACGVTDGADDAARGLKGCAEV